MTSMRLPSHMRDFYRNLKGRFDLMLFLSKWDANYRKDLTVTFLVFTLLIYSALTWNTVYDLVAMAIEVGIIMVQMGGEMSILPADYRPAHGGVRYSASPSTHIARNELSFLMSAVFPAKEEEPLDFINPIAGTGLCVESPLVSDFVDDTLMLRGPLAFIEDKTETNYVRSQHQLRYITMRVADKIQHTTNGEKLALYDLATALVGEQPVTVRKSFYFDALLTAEAFRSRLFRNNLGGEKELYTDLTSYFPVQEEEIGGEIGVRFQSDFYKKVSGHIGITTLLLTENRRIAMLYQGAGKAVGARTVTLGGSGSMDYSDLAAAERTGDLRTAITHAMACELGEETGMDDLIGGIEACTRLTGFFRWINRSGKPEFVGITYVPGIPFAQQAAIDGDEVVKFEEIPVTIETMRDFKEALEWIHDNKVNISLSSLMALHRMTVIADYGRPDATPEQRRIYEDMRGFLFS